MGKIEVNFASAMGRERPHHYSLTNTVNYAKAPNY